MADRLVDNHGEIRLMSNIHHSAADGYAVMATSYARGRPDYPTQVNDWLRDDLAVGKGKVAVDLGAGTGKFLAYILNTGATVVAVEPVPAMLAQLVNNHPGVEARQGSAERIPLADSSVDAVVCAQAFHWFANINSVNEIRRILKIGGALGLIWNVRDERVPWVARLRAILDPHEGDAPRYHTQMWRRVFPAAGFGPLSERHFPHGHTGLSEHVIVERVLSTSFIAALPAMARDHVREQVLKLIATVPELAGTSEVTMPYVTDAFSCRRVD